MKKWDKIESVHSWAAKEMFNSNNWPDQLGPEHTNFKFNQTNQTMKHTYHTESAESCEPKCQRSPVDEAFDEINRALNFLSESVNRIGIKTEVVRRTNPTDLNCNGKDSIKSAQSPLVERLFIIETDIRRQAEFLNDFSDDIQL